MKDMKRFLEFFFKKKPRFLELYQKSATFGLCASKMVSDGPVLLSPCMHVCPLPPPSGHVPLAQSPVRRASGSGQKSCCSVHYGSTGQAHTPSHPIEQATAAHDTRPDPDAA